MTPITKQQVEELIGRLKYKEFCHCGAQLSLACQRCKKTYEPYPIGVGRIIRLASVAWTEEQQEDQWLELVKLWYGCGAEDSLQEIARRIEWECVKAKSTMTINPDKKTMEMSKEYEVAKPSPQADLLLFIHNLGL